MAYVKRSMCCWVMWVANCAFYWRRFWTWSCTVSKSIFRVGNHWWWAWFQVERKLDLCYGLTGLWYQRWSFHKDQLFGLQPSHHYYVVSVSKKKPSVSSWVIWYLFTIRRGLQASHELVLHHNYSTCCSEQVRVVRNKGIVTEHAIWVKMQAMIRMQRTPQHNNFNMPQ